MRLLWSINTSIPFPKRGFWKSLRVSTIIRSSFSVIFNLFALLIIFKSKNQVVYFIAWLLHPVACPMHLCGLWMFLRNMEKWGWYPWRWVILFVKKQLFYVVMPTKSTQAISSIFSPKTQLGPNWQQPTTKMAVAWLRCDGESSEVIHILDNIILWHEKHSFAPLYHQPSRHRP